MTVYFLVLEFIGTPELVLIAFVALIVFGPRKLPSIARQIGKYTNEFKRASNEFRHNWESEVEAAEREEINVQSIKQANSFDKNQEISSDKIDELPAVENTIGRSATRRVAKSEDDFAALNHNELAVMSEIEAVGQTKAVKEEPQVLRAPSKREWL